MGMEGHEHREYPGPQAVERAASVAVRAGLNPGLLLDRLAFYRAGWRFDQEAQRDHLARVIAATEAQDSSAQAILCRWKEFLDRLPGTCAVWEQRLLWRLALHLSRATTVENGAICLHPIYGFAYLPGSGLKGLARAYAVLTGANREDIDRVFGPDTEAPQKSRGSVIFLDACPAKWPRLELDIVNVHHREYYRTGGQSAPGDWESPVPSYFLAVAPRTAFRFALACREPNRDASAKDLQLAKTWLQEGLQELGAGAKTGAGYGYFGPPSESASGAHTSSLDAFREALRRHVADGCKKQHRSRLWAALDALMPAGREAVRTALEELQQADPSICRSDKFQDHLRRLSTDE